MSIISIIALLPLLVLSACSGRPPFLEYALARSAVQAARRVDSEKNAASFWIKALHSYDKGQQNFQNRDYVVAKRFFHQSIQWAEKAENLSRSKISSGEGL